MTFETDLGSSLNLQHFAKSICKPPTQPAIPSGSPTTPSAISSPKPTVRKGSGRTGGDDLLLRPPGSSAALIAGHNTKNTKGQTIYFNLFVRNTKGLDRETGFLHYSKRSSGFEGKPYRATYA